MREPMPKKGDLVRLRREIIDSGNGLAYLYRDLVGIVVESRQWVDPNSVPLLEMKSCLVQFNNNTTDWFQHSSLEVLR